MRSKDREGSIMEFVSGAIHKEAVEASLKEPDLKANPAGTLRALMRAALIGETAGIVALIEKGADANASDQDGRTPLMEASFGGHTATVQALIDRGADVNAKDRDGWTALMEAAAKGHTDTVRALLAGGADPCASNRSGWSVSRLMARNNAEIAALIQSRP